MVYRKCGKLPVETSLLGYGMMRLPKHKDILDKNGFPYKTDANEAARLLRHAIDNGVNYVDTARVYGDSEEVTGIALKDGYREKVYLATKNPLGAKGTAEDWEKYLNESLKQLQTDHIDFYLQHNLNSKNWDNFKTLGIFEMAQKAKKYGRIKYFGFSFHDNCDVFLEILNEYDWDFCQIQFNYVDTEFQAGIKGLKAAHAKGVGVIVMEPLRGGRLVAYLPDEIQEELRENGINRTPADLALRWLANFPEISCMLSGMGTFDMVEQNLRTFSDTDVISGNIPEKETELVNKMAEKWKSYKSIDCTDCKYCMPCPFGVDIPNCIADLNWARSTRSDSWGARQDYRKLIARNADASQCVECGVCESKCPQDIAVIESLKAAHSTMLSFMWDVQ